MHHHVKDSKEYRGSLNYGHYHQPLQFNRHSVQVQKITQPSRTTGENQRSTHKPSYQNYNQSHYQKDFDPSSQQSTTNYNALKKLKAYRQYMPKEQTHRIRGERIMEPPLREQEQTQYIIIPARVKKPRLLVEYSDEQLQYPEDEQRVPKVSIISKQAQPIKMRKKQVVPLLASIPKRQFINSSNQLQKNQYANVQIQEQHNEEKTSSKRFKKSLQNFQSPKPKTDILYYRKQHTGFGPMIQQYEEQSSRNEASPDYNREDEEKGQFKCIDDNKIQYVYQGPQKLPRSKIMKYYEPAQVISKNKTLRSQSNIQKQIRARFKDIQSILEIQNQNLKDHNQYLLAVIKKMQSRDRKHRALLQNQTAIIEKLTEERNAYMERCLQLQNMVQNPYQKMAGKHQSRLTIPQNPQNMEGHGNPIDFNETINRTPKKRQRQEIAHDQERERKLGGLRQHFKSTINQGSGQKNSEVIAHKVSLNTQNNLNSINNQQHNSELHSYIDPTPKFFSKKQSPERIPKLQAKINPNKDDSERNSHDSQDFNDSGDLIENTNGSEQLNRKRGFNTIPMLSQNVDKREGNMKQDIESELISEQGEGSEYNYEIEGDDEETAINSYDNTVHVKNGEERAVEELNRKFEELMKLYRINHDGAIRKQCVQIAKTIKEMKQQLQEKKELETEKRFSQRLPHQGSSQVRSPALRRLDKYSTKRVI